MRRLCIVALLALALGASECEPAPPAERVATLEVTASLEYNHCGDQAVPADPTLAFAAEVLRDGTRAIWRRPGGSDLEGIYDDGTYVFVTHTQQVLIEPAPAWGEPGCTVDEVQATEMQITVEEGEEGADAGAPEPDAGVPDVPATMTGLLEIRLTPVADSYCVPMLAVAGGPFHALPCSLRYRLEGEGTAPAPVPPDAGTTDAGTTDAGTTDAGTTDAGSP
jgi:hypothetical protein